MKLLILTLPLLACSCSTAVQKNASSLLNTVAQYDIDAAKVSQKTAGPFYTHSESVAGLSHTPGHFSVEDLNANFDIPFPVLGIPLLHWEISAAHISGTKRSDVSSVVATPTK
jgi:hypothetical protein